MADKKVTKKDNFAAIVEVCVAAGREDLADTMRHEIELLENKASKAKATAAKKKSAPDALTEAVAVALTEDFSTIADITARVDLEGFDGSVAKVQYRLNKLVENGVATKEPVTVGEGTNKRKLMCYAYIPIESAE